MFKMSSPNFKGGKVSPRQRKPSAGANTAEITGNTPATSEKIPTEYKDTTLTRVDITSQAMLLRGLLAELTIGFVYDFKYQHKTMAYADALTAGKSIITILPSKWAKAVAEELWEYEIDETVTVDPTSIDSLTEQWVCVFNLGILPADEGDDEDEDHSEGDFPDKEADEDEDEDEDE